MLDQSSNKIIKCINICFNVLNVPVEHNQVETDNLEASHPAEGAPQPDDDGVELISHYGSECSDEYRPTDPQGNPVELNPVEGDIPTHESQLKRPGVGRQDKRAFP